MKHLSVEARPSRWRNVSFCLLLMPGTLILGELIGTKQVDIAQSSVIAIIVAIAASCWPRTELILRDGVLHGPRPFGLGRTSIPVEEIDVGRSRSPHLILSMRGQAIWVDAIAIPSEARRRIIEALGLTNRRA